MLRDGRAWRACRHNLFLRARGMLAKEIARSVRISEKTLRNGPSHLYSKEARSVSCTPHD